MTTPFEIGAGAMLDIAEARERAADLAHDDRRRELRGAKSRYRRTVRAGLTAPVPIPPDATAADLGLLALGAVAAVLMGDSAAKVAVTAREAIDASTVVEVAEAELDSVLDRLETVVNDSTRR